MEEIAAILGADGSSTTLTEPGNLVVFRREKGAWTNNRTMPLALGQTEGLREMRNKMAGLLAFLGDCRIVVTKSASGALYFELEKARCTLWEITGKPDEFLDPVWADEEKERQAERSPSAPALPVPKERTPGNFFISIKEVQGKRPDISSKQVLRQFIERGGFLVLEIVCSHVPPWIEVEAERRGYTLETEQQDKDTVKVRLTTNTGR